MFLFLFQTLCLKYDYTITSAFYNMMITRVLHAMVTRQGRENTWTQCLIVKVCSFLFEYFYEYPTGVQANNRCNFLLLLLQKSPVSNLFVNTQ